MAYCMGLISESMYHDLDIVKQIRNKFAHKMHGYSFDDPEIVKWCKSLKLATMISDVSPLPNSHGNLFILGVSQLAMWLGMKILETEKLHKTVPKDPTLAQYVRVDGNTKAA